MGINNRDMKNIFLILTVFTVLFSASCKKFDNEKALTFDVSVDATTVKVGDPVTFKITGGDANQISFYSGEVGNDYEYRDKNRIDEIKKVFFSFQTHNVPVGHLVYPDVMVSTDFNGIYDYDNVSKATWKNLSNLYKWGANGPWQTMWTASGNADITSYLEDGKPFYVAFRVKSDPYPTGTPSRNWRTNGHSMIAETIGGNYVSLADFKGMSWKLVDKYLDPDVISTQSSSTVSTSIMLLGYYNSTSPRYRQEAEVWGVSKRHQSGIVNLGPSKSVSLKQYTDIPLETHTHYYENPGTYKVVFLASNATISSSSQVIKELEITVNP